MSRLKISKADPNVEGLLRNIRIEIDGVEIRNVESLQLWVNRDTFARVALTFEPDIIDVDTNVLVQLQAFIDSNKQKAPPVEG